MCLIFSSCAKHCVQVERRPNRWELNQYLKLSEKTLFGILSCGSSSWPCHRQFTGPWASRCVLYMSYCRSLKWEDWNFTLSLFVLFPTTEQQDLLRFCSTTSNKETKVFHGLACLLWTVNNKYAILICERISFIFPIMFLFKMSYRYFNWKKQASVFTQYGGRNLFCILVKKGICDTLEPPAYSSYWMARDVHRHSAKYFSTCSVNYVKEGHKCWGLDKSTAFPA